MQFSKIEWTEVTWNPTTGCNKVSAGCKNCYAESFSKRLKGMGIEKYKNGFYINLGSWLTAPCYGIFKENKFEIIDYPADAGSLLES